MSSILFIMGDSPEKANDLEAWKSFQTPCDFCCINRAGLWFPAPFEFWYSYHHEELQGWAVKRPDFSGKILSYYPGVLSPPILEGSSTLQMVSLALTYLKYDKVVVGGASIQGDYGKYFGPYWERLAPKIKQSVRAMSGLPKNLLGYPTKEWIYTQVKEDYQWFSTFDMNQISN